MQKDKRALLCLLIKLASKYRVVRKLGVLMMFLNNHKPGFNECAEKTEVL